jgi:hypothetical protein
MKTDGQILKEGQEEKKVVLEVVTGAKIVYSVKPVDYIQNGVHLE